MDIQQIWNEYGSKLRSFLLTRVKRPEDADDLLQEILIKTHQNLSSLQDTKKFQSWLFQIARNTLTDYYRGHTMSGQALPEAIATDDPNNEPNIRQELSKCIQPFIQSLPEKYGDAVTAVDLQGISQKALAEELGLSHSAIKSRVQRGRQMLAELFKSCCSYELDARGNIMDFETGCC